MKRSLCRTAGRCFSHGGGGEGGGVGWKGDDGDGSGREGGGDSGEVVEWWRGGGEVEEVVERCEGKKRYLSAGFLHLSTPTWSIKSTSASQK